MTDQTRIIRVLRAPAADKKRTSFLSCFDELERLGARADFLGDAVQLIVENIAEPLGEDEREDVVLVLGGVLRAADRAGGVPDPGFERFAVAGLRQGVTSPRSGLRNMRCTVNEHAIVSIRKEKEGSQAGW